MFSKFLSAFALIAAVASAHAQDTGEKVVRDAMHSLLPMTQIDEVVKSDLPGFYEVIVSGQVVYVSADGKYRWLSGRFDDVVYRIDTTSGAVDKIKVGREPHGLTVWPQPGRYSLGHTGNLR